MGGESHGNGNANATSRGVHPPATAAVVANGRSGKGNAGKGGGEGSYVEKRKFTVSVRGRHWSSVRYVNETLEEFAAAILRDVRRLAFRDSADFIQRLRLEYSEGSEPEILDVDLDVDATFGVGIICMGNEQLLDIVKQHLPIVESTQLTPQPRMPRTGTPKQNPDSECTPQITNAIDRNCHDSVAAPRSSPDLLARSAAPKFPFPDYEPPCSGALTTNPRASKNYTPPESPSLQFQPVERAWSFHPDYVAGAGSNLPPLPRSRGKLNMGGAGQEKYLRSPNHPGGANNAKRSLRGATSHGNSKKKSLSSSSNSSAHVRNSWASQSGDGEGLDNELPNGGSELVFEVHRRSKTRLHGVGTHYLKMSDISAHFHLTLYNAAEELGVSETTLKKACRHYGLGRWPGRKFRSLQRTTQGLLHESVVGQRTALKESNESLMRSKFCKLQQELDQLVHGNPAQVTQKMHSPSVRTVCLYKRLSSPGGRSKYHSAGRHDIITSDPGNPTKRASGLWPSHV